MDAKCTGLKSPLWPAVYTKLLAFGHNADSWKQWLRLSRLYGDKAEPESGDENEQGPDPPKKAGPRRRLWGRRTRRRSRQRSRQGR